MNPYRPYRPSAVPRTLHVQLEIANAVRTLMAPDEDERLRARRAEIAAIRRDLDALARDLPRAFAEAATLAKAELGAVLAKKYNPDQPRVPSGNRDGGQWTSGSKAGSEAASAQSLSEDDTSGKVSEGRIRYASLENPTAGTRTGVMGRSGGTADTSAEDIKVMNNLPSILHTVLSQTSRNLIWSSEIADDHPRHPVPFVDSDGMPVLDSLGNRILRPDELPPERYLRAGLANQSRLLVTALLSVSPGGVLDAERFDWNYVRDYRH
jgi:hypothetical protein